MPLDLNKPLAPQGFEAIKSDNFDDFLKICDAIETLPARIQQGMAIIQELKAINYGGIKPGLSTQGGIPRPKLEDTFEYRDSDGNTLLHFAAAYSRPKFVQELIKRKVKDDVENENKETPLLILAQQSSDKCCCESAAMLINAFAVRHRDDKAPYGTVHYFSLPLQRAATNCNPRLAELLLRAGANPNDISDYPPHRSIFELAMEAKEVKSLERALECIKTVCETAGVEVAPKKTSKDSIESGTVVLESKDAHTLEKDPTVKFPIKIQANTLQRAILAAISQGYREILTYLAEVLYKNGHRLALCEPNTNYKFEAETALFRAVAINSPLTLKIIEIAKSHFSDDLNAFRAYLDERGPGLYDKVTAFYEVIVSKGDLKTASLLRDTGADINAPTGLGSTPVYSCASYEDNASFCELAIDEKTDFNQKDKYDLDTPLHRAVKRSFESKSSRVVVNLISKGFTINSENKEFDTPLSLSAKSGNRQLLLDTLAAAKDSKNPPTPQTIVHALVTVVTVMPHPAYEYHKHYQHIFEKLLAELSDSDLSTRETHTNQTIEETIKESYSVCKKILLKLLEQEKNKRLEKSKKDHEALKNEEEKARKNKERDDKERKEKARKDKEREEKEMQMFKREMGLPDDAILLPDLKPRPAVDEITAALENPVKPTTAVSAALNRSGEAVGTRVSAEESTLDDATLSTSKTVHVMRF